MTCEHAPLEGFLCVAEGKVAAVEGGSSRAVGGLGDEARVVLDLVDAGAAVVAARQIDDVGAM